MRHCHKKLLKLANFNCFSRYIYSINSNKEAHQIAPWGYEYKNV